MTDEREDWHGRLISRRTRQPKDVRSVVSISVLRDLSCWWPRSDCNDHGPSHLIQWQQSRVLERTP